ncbi:MAG: methylmalonyl Co-A mutase-associated GTPase MeaB [Bacteroidetes bacterium]|nr:methylmalonyl Co-A mutase-associated GTPase MeaB [Bacteroidota bacterium]
MSTTELLKNLHDGDRRALARCISIVENDSNGALEILQELQTNKNIPIIGITGPPGAGKSTLVSALISYFMKTKTNCKVAVLAVDPTSPFTNGSLLGDRLRMTEHFNNPDVFIRSLATRGALGGLSAKTLEITDLLLAAGFDFIFIETVGVGQSEIEIVSLAETTVVVFVPESGDEIQTIKSGIMEVGDIFVVNKSDREGADRMVKNLKTTLHERAATGWEVPVVKTIASTQSGIPELAQFIQNHHAQSHFTRSSQELLLNKALRLAQNYALRKTDLIKFKQELELSSGKPDFNLYRFLSNWFS